MNRQTNIIIAKPSPKVEAFFKLLQEEQQRHDDYAREKAEKGDVDFTITIK